MRFSRLRLDATTGGVKSPLAGRACGGSGRPLRLTSATSALRRGALACCPARRLVALAVALELGEARRERVLAAGSRLYYVVEVAHMRGARRRADRVEAGVADRAGRQARVLPGVVGGIDRELARCQRRT